MSVISMTIIVLLLLVLKGRVLLTHAKRFVAWCSARLNGDLAMEGDAEPEPGEHDLEEENNGPSRASA